MNNKKDVIEMFLLGSILIVLICLLVVTGYKTKLELNEKNDKNTNVNENISNDDKNSQNLGNKNNVSDNSVNDYKDNVSSNDVQINDNPSNNNSNNVDDENKTPSINLNDNEESIVSYFINANNELDNYKDQNNVNFQEKAKNIFTTTIDFLFYDKEIKGYTFKELSLAAKLKILKIVASIDNKIDNYFPDYKQNIKDKYVDIKGKIAVLYLETINKFCSNEKESVCQTARDDFNNMKTSYGYTWEILKNAFTSSKDKLSVVLSEWYKSIK